jgi:hypothetical protein
MLASIMFPAYCIQQQIYDQIHEQVEDPKIFHCKSNILFLGLVYSFNVMFFFQLGYSLQQLYYIPLSLLSLPFPSIPVVLPPIPLLMVVLLPGHMLCFKMSHSGSVLTHAHLCYVYFYFEKSNVRYIDIRTRTTRNIDGQHIGEQVTPEWENWYCIDSHECRTTGAQTINAGQG